VPPAVATAGAPAEVPQPGPGPAVAADEGSGEQIAQIDLEELAGRGAGQETGDLPLLDRRRRARA